MSARVWLPGGEGMLGRAAARVLAATPHEAVATGRDVPLDDEAAVESLLDREPITHVLNCAGYTAVDRAESEPEAAERDNARAPGVLSIAAGRRALPVVHVSTDYVFGGDASAPVPEDAATAPRSVYGRTKLAGEQAFLSAPGEGARYVVRTSWLFGREGHHFVGTMLRLMAEREELRVVDDQHGCPTFADDLARAAIGLLGLDPRSPEPREPGTYHFANPPAVTWCGFARRILEVGRELGLPLVCERVVPITSAEYPTPAERPRYSVLATEKIRAALGEPIPSWEVGLRQVVNDRLEAS